MRGSIFLRAFAQAWSRSHSSESRGASFAHSRRRPSASASHLEDSQLHELRISLKRARYAAELSAATGTSADLFFEAAKTLQGLLGEHQDAAVAESLLREATVVDKSTAAAFVAGRIAERQPARMARAKESDSRGVAAAAEARLAPVSQLIRLCRSELE